MKRLELHLIVAIAENGAIGINGDMPWQRELPADLKHFKKNTLGHPIIMGRRTYESFPKGALPGRTNLVVTRDRAYTAPGIMVVHSLEEAIEVAERESDKAFIIGGGQLYHQSLEQELVDVMHITVVHHTWEEADTFFPKIDVEKWKMVEEEQHDADERNKYPYTFTTFVRSDLSS